MVTLIRMLPGMYDSQRAVHDNYDMSVIVEQSIDVHCCEEISYRLRGNRDSSQLVTDHRI